MKFSGADSHVLGAGYLPETSENLHIFTWLSSRENFDEKIAMFRKGNED